MTEMTVATFVAQFMSLYYIAFFIGMTFEKKFYKDFVKKVSTDITLTFSVGPLLLLTGLLVVVNHNVRAMDWTVLVTIVGWGALIKGFTMIALPTTFAKMSEPFMKGPVLIFSMTVSVLLAIVFFYYGFIVG